MDYSAKIQWLTQIEKRKWVLMVGLVALTHLFCQSLMLPYGNALLSLLPDERSNSLPMASSSSVEASIDDVSKPGSESLLVRKVKSTKAYNVGLDGGGDDGSVGKKGEEKVNFGLDGNGADDDLDFVEDDSLDNVNVELEVGLGVENGRIRENGSSEVVLESRTSGIQEENVTQPLLIESVVGEKPEGEASISVGASGLHSPLGERRDVDAVPNNGSSVPAKKKMRSEMPPKTVTYVDEMERLLIRNRARSRAMRPRWSSERDQEILAAKTSIESAPVLKNDRELHAPLFRNISMFKSKNCGNVGEQKKIGEKKNVEMKGKSGRNVVEKKTVREEGGYNSEEENSD